MCVHACQILKHIRNFHLENFLKKAGGGQRKFGDKENLLNNWTHKTITMTITKNKQTHPEIKSKIHVTSGKGLCAESYPYDLN